MRTEEIFLGARAAPARCEGDPRGETNQPARADRRPNAGRNASRDEARGQRAKRRPERNGGSGEARASVKGRLVLVVLEILQTPDPPLNVLRIERAHNGALDNLG